MVGSIKMKPGMEVGLGPVHIVLDGDPAPSPWKWHSSPSLFGQCLLSQTVAHLSYCWALVL